MNQQWQPPPKDDPPICHNCRYYDGYMCNHGANSKFSPVGGRHSELKAYEMRTKGKCGHLGMLFEPRPPSRWKRFKTYLKGTTTGSDC